MKDRRSLIPVALPLLFMALPVEALKLDYDQMVSIPGATFKMGCNPMTDYVCAYVPEEKMHTVELDSFNC